MAIILGLFAKLSPSSGNTDSATQPRTKHWISVTGRGILQESSTLWRIYDDHTQTTSTFTPRFLLYLKLLPVLTVATLLVACPSPGGGGTPPPETYTTTVKGKVITPARAADPAKGSIITTARVWASTDPTKKVDVGADGSYSLQVAGHSGSFTITAEYTATGNKNYKTSDPKAVTTTGAAIENQDIPLNYGYTTEVTVQVALYPAAMPPTIGNGVAVVITAENGHEVGRGLTSGVVSPNGVVITVDHPGMIRGTASNTGYTSASNDRTLTLANTGIVVNLFP